MEFLVIFTSGRCHRDMKILKILVSNSKQLRVHDILKKWQIPLAMFFSLTKLKNDIKIALKPTAIKLQANPNKRYHAVYICEEKDVALSLNKSIFNCTLLNTIKLIGGKLSSSFFLAHSQSSIEVRQIFRTNFIKLLLYIKFLFEKPLSFLID